jgi:hypothetical protein
MSVFTGMGNPATGRIKANSAIAVVSYWRGLPISADYKLCFDSTNPIASVSSGIPITTAGKVATSAGPIASYCSGIPYDAAGKIVATAAAAVSYDQGVGLTAGGGLALE